MHTFIVRVRHLILVFLRLPAATFEQQSQKNYNNHRNHGSSYSSNDNPGNGPSAQSGCGARVRSDADNCKTICDESATACLRDNVLHISNFIHIRHSTTFATLTVSACTTTVALSTLLDDCTCNVITRPAAPLDMSMMVTKYWLFIACLVTRGEAHEHNTTP